LIVRDLVLSSHFRKLKSSLGTNKAASKLGKLEQSLHITQDGYALYELGENSITLSPNDSLFLSITLVLPVKMEYVYKRLVIIYSKHLLLFDESYQV
jgi:hypothetical protein